MDVVLYNGVALYNGVVHFKQWGGTLKWHNSKVLHQK